MTKPIPNHNKTAKSNVKAAKVRHSPEDMAAKRFLKSAFIPVKRQMNLAVVCDVLSTLLLIVQSAIIVMIFDGWLIKFIPGFEHHDAMSMAMSGVFLSALLAVFILRALIGYGRDALLIKTGMTVATSVRSQLLAQLAKLGMARRFFGADGALASKIIDEPAHLMGYARFDVQKKSVLLTPLILTICIAYFNKIAALILIATAPLVPIFMIIIGVSTARKSREQMDAMAQMGGRFLDWIRGVNTLARLGAVDIATDDIEHSAERYRASTMDVLKIAFLNSAVLEFLSALSIALVAVYLGFGLIGILPWQSGVTATTYANALMILLLVPEFYAPLRRLGAEYHVKGQAEGAAKSMVGLLSYQPAAKGSALVHDVAMADIELVELCVTGDEGRVRLPKSSLSFKAGQTSAIIGESGSGKSTILQTLLGFGDYTGQIWLVTPTAKHELKTVDIDVLRAQMGYLSQIPALLPLTIIENLLLARPDATVDDCWQALKAVQMDEVVARLPHGLDTPLGERGSGVSGGQAQRLAIAQLLLQNATIWLLDEPTEHLDAETSQAVQDLLHRLGQDKTVIWVTHDTNLSRFDYYHKLKPVKDAYNTVEVNDGD